MDRTLAAWGMVYRTDTGELYSRGTVVADPLPAGLALLEVPADIDPKTQHWDTTTRTIQPGAS